jgi:mannose-6-phosphate isomerase
MPRRQTRTQLFALDEIYERNYGFIDSFVIYICFEGRATVETDHGNIELKKGDSILLPAVIDKVKILPHGSCKFLETYVP